MQYDCDLLLRQSGDEKRMPHRFIAEIEPGRFLRLEGRDWDRHGDSPRRKAPRYLSSAWRELSGDKGNGQSEGLTVSGE
jgi:hypothetical protein